MSSISWLVTVFRPSPSFFRAISDHIWLSGWSLRCSYWLDQTENQRFNPGSCFFICDCQENRNDPTAAARVIPLGNTRGRMKLSFATWKVSWLSRGSCDVVTLTTSGPSGCHEDRECDFTSLVVKGKMSRTSVFHKIPAKLTQTLNQLQYCLRLCRWKSWTIINVTN